VGSAADRRDPAGANEATPTPARRITCRATLERIVGAKGMASAATLARYRDAWDHAADRTPHGMPIALEPRDFPD
jgi:hypothetical protein